VISIFPPDFSLTSRAKSPAAIPDIEVGGNASVMSHLMVCAIAVELATSSPAIANDLSLVATEYILMITSCVMRRIDTAQLLFEMTTSAIPLEIDPSKKTITKNVNTG
jgi:hypothetical protein